MNLLHSATAFSLYPRYWLRCALVLLCVLMSAPRGIAEEAENASAAADWHKSVVQVLAYKGDELLNQGSGVIVADGGVVVTNAHLLNSADKIVVRSGAGENSDAIVLTSDANHDLAVLRSGVAGAAMPLSIRALAEGNAVEVAGYWHAAQEESRKSLFGLSKKPKFIAKVVPELKLAKALPNSIDTDKGSAELVTSVGRGAYGAAVVNRCGELLALVTPAPGQSLKELWKPHTPLGATVVDLNVLGRIFENSNIEAVRASQECLTAYEQSEQDRQDAEKASRAELEKEKEKAQKARDDAEKAQKEKEEAEKGKEEAERNNQDISSIASDMSAQAEAEAAEKEKAEQANKTLMLGLAAGGVVALLVILMLIAKRRKDLTRAEQAIADASAVFSDCQLSGVDSSGKPVALTILGRDLMQRENGLVLGRNPEVSQVILADDSVSRQHARLSVVNDRLNIEDLGSTGGTSVNGVPVAADATVLIDGDVVKFAAVTLTIKFVEAG